MLGSNLGPLTQDSLPSGGVPGQILVKDGNGKAGWGSVAGTGDVVGDTSSVSGNIAIFSGSTGKAIEDSGKNLSDLAWPVQFRSYFDGINEIVGERASYKALGVRTLKRVELRSNKTRTAGTVTASLKVNSVEFGELVLNLSNADSDSIDTNIVLLEGDILSTDVVTVAFSPKTGFFDLIYYMV